MQSNRRRVLHVTSWPGPPFDGGRINRYHVLKRLSQRHSCRFVIVCEPGDSAGVSGGALRDLGIAHDGLEIVERPAASPATRLRGLLGSRRPPGVDLIERHAGRHLREAVDRLAAEGDPHAVMIWSPNWAGSLAPTQRQRRRILFACDSLSMLHASIARQSRGFRRLYHAEVARRYRVHEQSHYPQYDAVVFVGHRDAEAAGLPGGMDVEVIPNGVDTDQLRPLPVGEAARRPRILFHGFLGYVANERCVRYLADVLGPQLAARLGNGAFEIRVLGGGASRALRARVRGKPWLTLAGYVDDLATELGRATVYAAPLEMGGGIKNKVLEAMSCGLPVVGTREAFEAIPIRPGIEGVEVPLEDFAAEVLQLIADPPQRWAIGRAARQWVVRNANWDAVAERFEQLFTDTAAQAERYPGRAG